MAQQRKMVLSAILRMVDEVTRPARRIAQAIRIHILAPFRKAAFAVAGFGKSMLGLGASAFRGLAWVSGGIGLGLAAVGKAVSDSADSMDRLAKSSRQVGLSVEELSRLAYAADLSGVSFEELLGGLRPFTKNLALAKLGSGKLFSLLSKTSPQLLSALKGTASVQEAFELVAGAVASTEDKTRRNAIAMAAFGNSGAKFASLFADGAEGVRKMTDEADRLGFTVSTESATAAEAFNDDLNRLKRTIGLVARTVGETLIPELKPLIESTTKWIQANRGLVASKIIQWAKRAAAVLVWLGNVSERIASFIENIDTERLARSWQYFGTAIAKAGAGFRRIWDDARAAIDRFIGWFRSAWDGVKSWFSESASLMGTVFANLWDKAILPIAGFVDHALNILTFGLWDPIKATLGWIADKAIGGIKWAIEGVWGAFKGFGEWIGTVFRGVFESLWSYIEPIMQGIADAVDATIEGLRAIGIIDEPQVNYEALGATGAGLIQALPQAQAAIGSGLAALGELSTKSRVELDVQFKDAPPGLRVSRPQSDGPITGRVQVKTAPTGRRTLTSGEPL